MAAAARQRPGAGVRAGATSKAAWTREPGRARAGYANVAEFLRKYSEAGGKVLAATDTGCCAQIVPGLSLHYEMQMLTDMGITPMKAIQGATLWSAEVIGQEQGSRQHRAGQARRLHDHRGESAGRHRRDEEHPHGDQGRRGDGHRVRPGVGEPDPEGGGRRAVIPGGAVGSRRGRRGRAKIRCLRRRLDRRRAPASTRVGQ